MHKIQQSFAKAFTLLELSIVLVVISVLTVGVFMGAGLIDSSRLSVARSLTERSVVPQIDGLVVWYETSLLTSFKESEIFDNATITTWYDNNPSSIPSKKNSLVQKTGEVKYVRKGINNIPSLWFNYDGSSVSNLELAAFSEGSSSQNTIFIVFKQLYRIFTTHNAVWILDNHTSNDNYGIGYSDNSSSDDLRTYAGAGIQTTSNPAQYFEDNKLYISAYYVDRNYSKAYLNDAINLVGGGYISSDVGSNELKSLTVGSIKGETNGNRFSGLISEIIIYNRSLKEKERKDIFRYLSKKYNIAVVGI